MNEDILHQLQNLIINLQDLNKDILNQLQNLVIKLLLTRNLKEDIVNQFQIHCHPCEKVDLFLNKYF